jgi:hypothetical protein
MLRRLLIATVLLLLAAATPAIAAEPIMPLSEVQPGMRCTGLSVIQGTTISSFDVDIIDVVPGDQVADQPLLLVKVSGPAVDDTGIAEGFSGSPVICDGRIAGAIAYGSGDYGNQLGYATPIEAMLDAPVPPAPAIASLRTPTIASLRTPTIASLRTPADARPLATPIAVSGVTDRVFAPFAKAAAKAGIRLTTVPVAPDRSRFPAQTLTPGASVAVGLSSGDLTAGAIGTVTYVDGAKVYAFGHPFNGTGRRSLLLQDAWVYAVVDNPLGTEDAVSAKLAAPGHDLGTLTYDGRDGVAGLLGATPPTTQLTVTARNAVTGQTRVSHAQVADEAEVGLPDGVSPIVLTAPMAVSQAAYTALDGSPVLQSARMCVRLTIAQLSKPTGFCRRYVGAYGGDQATAGGPFVTDLSTALTDLDLFNYGAPKLTKVDVALTVRPGLQQALVRSVDAPARIRRGHDARLVLHLQRYRGERFTRVVRLRVPRDAPLGRVEVALTGSPLDDAVGSDDIEIVLGDEGPSDGGDSSPKSYARLGDQVRALAGYDGVRVRLRKAGGRGRTAPQRLYADPQLRISGTASTTARVVR